MDTIRRSFLLVTTIIILPSFTPFPLLLGSYGFDGTRIICSHSRLPRGRSTLLCSVSGTNHDSFNDRSVAIGLIKGADESVLDIIASRISCIGASPLSSNLDISSHNPISWSRIRNPRDARTTVISEQWKDKCTNSDGVIAASMTSSVADGSVSSAILVVDSSPPSNPLPDGISDELRAIMGQCASWTGTTLYTSDIKISGLVSTMIITSKVADVLTLLECVTCDEVNMCSVTSRDFKKFETRPLAGFRIAVIPDRTTYDLYSTTNKIAEPSVKLSVNCASEVFTRLGAECIVIKATKVSGRSGSPSRVIGVEELAGCHILLTPAFRSSALSSFPIELQKASDITLAPEIAVRLRTCEMLCIPGGLSAFDNDGYDSDEDEDAINEGMPIGIQLSSLADEGTEFPNNIVALGSVLRAGAAFEYYTRWSSEVFPPGATREQAKDDIDDAREAFGFYFVSSLLRYFGKKN